MVGSFQFLLGQVEGQGQNTQVETGTQQLLRWLRDV